MKTAITTRLCKSLFSTAVRVCERETEWERWVRVRPQVCDSHPFHPWLVALLDGWSIMAVKEKDAVCWVCLSLTVSKRGTETVCVLCSSLVVYLPMLTGSNVSGSVVTDSYSKQEADRQHGLYFGVELGVSYTWPAVHQSWSLRMNLLPSECFP